ncbi:MAG: hypothetical protein BRD46_03795 [Bacteroidetes bacterium QS_8_68_15]|nr:MAG: hypothetical protein BRD46_03795 [Bacteroidetes bacterium QS_8_68_15]
MSTARFYKLSSMTHPLPFIPPLPISMRNARSPLSFVLFAAAALLLSGCFHTNFTTGKPAGDQVIEKPWASSFVNGLIPPGEVDTAEECENGVAQVETKRSFLNMLAQGITLSLYSPMHLKVTCAASDGMATTEDAQPSHAEVVVPQNATPVEKTATFNEAAAQAVESGQPVQVRFEQPGAAAK